jgi:formylmethanofuran dehydrogenase subunit E
MKNEAQVKLPEWAWEFHGHRCPFMPIGYRMGVVAMRELGIERVKDHGAFALVEMGVGHPQNKQDGRVMSPPDAHMES